MQDLVEFLEEYGISEDKYEIKEDKMYYKDDCLSLSGRGVNRLPKNIGKLVVEHLCLDVNRIKVIPNSLFESDIRIIGLSCNRIKTIPKTIGKFKGERIYLGSNEIEEIPENISETSFRFFNITDNNIKELPKSINDTIIYWFESDFDIKGNEFRHKKYEIGKDYVGLNIDGAFLYFKYTQKRELNDYIIFRDNWSYYFIVDKKDNTRYSCDITLKKAFKSINK